MRRKTVFFIPVILFIAAIFLLYINIDAIGDAFYKSKKYNIAATIYKVSYNTSNKIGTLEKLSDCYYMMDDYHNSAYYYSLLVEDERYIDNKNIDHRDVTITNYLQSLLENREMGKLREFYNRYVLNLNDNLFIRRIMVSRIAQKSDSGLSKEDYKFALLEAQELYNDPRVRNSNMMDIYHDLIVLNDILGNRDAAQKYRDEGQKYVEEKTKSHETNN
jgi:hypothetical protein